MSALVTVEDLASRLQKSPATIRAAASRNPESLPPICRLPGTKRLYWRAEDVDNWLAAHVVPVTRAQRQVLVPEPSRRPLSKRGRPTKSEARARRTMRGAP